MVEEFEFSHAPENSAVGGTRLWEASA